MSNDYFIATWSTKFSNKLESQIDKAIKVLDPEACFYKQDIPGSSSAVLVRPNDGWNETSEGSATNKQMRDLVDKMRQSGGFLY